jgi:hypothetical protein
MNQMRVLPFGDEVGLIRDHPPHFVSTRGGWWLFGKTG